MLAPRRGAQERRPIMNERDDDRPMRMSLKRGRCEDELLSNLLPKREFIGGSLATAGHKSARAGEAQIRALATHGCDTLGLGHAMTNER